MATKVDYLFCISAGRSGSHYLKTLFEHVDGCRAFHLPEPKGIGLPMRRFLRGHPGPMKRIARKKAGIMLRTRQQGEVHAETHHSFIKGYGWYLPEYLCENRIGVVILRRDRRKIAQSLLRIGCSPLRPLGRKMIVTPEKRNPLISPPKVLATVKMTYYLAYSLMFLCRVAERVQKMHFLTGRRFLPGFLSNYERACMKWYLEEIGAEEKAFRKKYPQIKYYEVAIEDLNSLDNVRNMLSYFGLKEKDSLSEVVGKPTNLMR